MNVVNWVQDFDPQNVNMHDFTLPTQLRTLDSYARSATREFPKATHRYGQIDDSRNASLAVQHDSPGRAKTRTELSRGDAVETHSSVQKSFNSAERRGMSDLDKIRMSDELISESKPG